MDSVFWRQLRVESLHYHPHADEIYLCGEAEGKNVALLFRGIRQLRIECDVPMEFLVDFRIEDVSDCQLEGVKFNVREETPGQIRFQCADAMILDAGDASHSSFRNAEPRDGST